MMNAGQKIEIKVTMIEKNARVIKGKHGWVNSIIRDYTFRGADGTTYKFHTTGCEQFYKVYPNDTITIRATVKEVTDTEVILIRARLAK